LGAARLPPLAATKWLQFVFLVRVRSLIESGGVFPSSSQVGIHAMREFDGQAEAHDLRDLLHTFDALFGS
jgi:uncharacterized protein YqcC (DUF446 family)